MVAPNPATPSFVTQQDASALGGATTEPLYVRAWPCACSLTVATSGKVQYTMSSYAHIAADTAVWHDWDLGVVTSNTAAAAPGPVTGLRGVSVVGAITLEVTNKAQR